jgi:hypothetical protein
MASALIELSGFVDQVKKQEYLGVAENRYAAWHHRNIWQSMVKTAISSLCTVWNHCLQTAKLDVPLTYADYYFIEALIRYRKLLD